MKFASAFLAVFVFGALAQTSSAPVVIKDWYGLVMFLRFSPNGGELARIKTFGPAALFDTTSYRRARTFLTEIEHTPEMVVVAYSPDGTRIATVDGYNGARVWNAADPGKPTATKESFLVVDELYVLDTPLRVLQASSPPEQKPVWTEFSPDGKLLITTHANGHVKVWNTSSWTVQGELIVTDSRLGVAAFAPDSKTVIIGDANGVLHLWSLATKAEIRALPIFDGVGSLSVVPAPVDVAFSPDGKTLVATYLSKESFREDGAAMIWNTTDWIVQTESGYNSAAFSKDGKLLALGGRRHIRLIEPASRKQIRDIELPDLMTLGELSPNLENHPNAKEKVPCHVLALAFSPDGNTLATGCAEGTVRLAKMTP
jgi:WD40 repeat protein